jgi:arginase
MRDRKICSVIGASSHIGQTKEGVEIAPQWLRFHGAKDILAQKFEKIYDYGDFSPNIFMDKDKSELDVYLRYSQYLSDNIFEAYTRGEQVLTIGGDHSIALSSLNASLAIDPNLKVIWVDAHADINTFETSPSGNLHGMPLAFLFGIMQVDSEKTSWINRLKPENLVYIGLRDVDPGEQHSLDELGIKYFTAEDVANTGIDKVLLDTYSYLNMDETTNLHLSFDVDGVDPKYFPATGTPVSKGLSLNDAKSIIQTAFKNYHVLGFDLVEINTMLGDEKDLKTTLESSLELLDAIELGYVDLKNMTQESKPLTL